MIDDYPPILTILMLITSVTAGGLGIAVVPNPPPVLPDETGIMNETQCSTESVPEENILTDEVVSLAPGEERQFTYTVPNNNSDIKLIANTLTGADPIVTVSGPNGSVRIDSVASELSEERITTTPVGQYALTLSNDNQFQSEVDLRVFYLQCRT